MEAYTGFASVYDRFMNEIPYEDWVIYLTELLKEYGISNGLICELGCGTGNITRRLAKRGYDMIGIDSSFEMLSLAREKESEKATESILYLMQDMREFELYGTVAGFISLCDSMNYITKEEELEKVFRLVNNYLDSNGIFIFDLKTAYYFENVLGSSTFAQNEEDCSLIWENFYDTKTKLNEYALTIYYPTEPKQKLYERIEETHIQRAYSLEKIKELLVSAGMEFVTAYDALTKCLPSDTSERIYVIAKEKHQENKWYL